MIEKTKLCLLPCNRQRTELAVSQLLHAIALIFLCGETASDLGSIRNDIPGEAHLTDTYHFLCPCVTLSALVHSQTTLTLASANTHGVNELKSPIPKPILPNVLSCPAFFSSCARQRETVTVRKGQTCSSASNSAPIGDSALKVEYRIKGLIILPLKWDSVSNFCQE